MVKIKYFTLPAVLTPKTAAQAPIIVQTPAKPAKPRKFTFKGGWRSKGNNWSKHTDGSKAQSRAQSGGYSIGTWKLGSGGKSGNCDDCAANDGQSWAVDDIPAYPGDGATQCGGNCTCSIEFTDDGVAAIDSREGVQLATNVYYARFKSALLAMAKKRGGVVTSADIDAAHKHARAAAGGSTKAANAQVEVAANDVVLGNYPFIADDDTPMDADDTADSLEVKGSFEDLREDLRNMLQERYGKYISIVATYPDHVIYTQWGTDNVSDSYWAQSFTGTGDEDDTDEQLIQFGPRVAVERATVFQPIKAENPNEYAVSLVDPLGQSNAPIMLAFTKDVNPFAKKPDAPSGKSKVWTETYNAAYAACMKGDGAKDGACKTQATTKADAADKAPVKAEDYSDVAFILSDPVQLQDEPELDGIRTLVSLRLADTPGTGGTIPQWQQYHKIGEHAIEHGIAGKIALTRKMGDNMVKNFKSNVIRKPLTLDENHNSAGKALAKAVDMQWGGPDAGLPGKADPNGKGDILYVKWDYNEYGKKVLSDGQYFNQSPQYEYDYPDKESGRKYGVTATGCAVTNNPYLRLRTFQGEAAPAPVLLTDAAPAHTQGGIVAGEPQTISLTEWNAHKERLAKLEEENARIKTHNAELTDTVTTLSGANRGDAVKVLLDEQKRLGLDPAWANKARKVLLHLNPAESPDNGIKLTDDAAAEPVNLYDAIVDLVTTVPKRPVNRAPVTTVAADRRPVQNGAQLQDEQIELAEARYASDLLKSVGQHPEAAKP